MTQHTDDYAKQAADDTLRQLQSSENTGGSPLPPLEGPPPPQALSIATSIPNPQ